MNGVPDPFRLSAMRRRRVPRAEVDVEHGDVDLALGDQLRRLIGVVRRADHGAAGLLENVDQNHRDERLVLEDQHALACQRLPSCPFL